MSREKKVTAWIESNLVVGTGDSEGNSFKVLPWQRKLLRLLLDRENQTVSLTIARGNGKTAFAAVLLSLFRPGGPLHAKNLSIVSVSPTGRQVKLLWEDFLRINQIQNTGRRRKDDDYRVLGHAAEHSVQHADSGVSWSFHSGKYARNLMGLRPSLCVLDEPASLENPEEVYTALKTSLGKSTFSKLLVLGTRSPDSTHFFTRLLESPAVGEVVLDYSVPTDTKKPLTWANVKKANPSIDYLPSLKDTVKRELDQAKTELAALHSFKALRLNYGEGRLETAALISPETYQIAEKSDLSGRERVGAAYVGLDLGYTISASSIAVFYPRSGFLEFISGFPAEPSLEERAKWHRLPPDFFQRAVDKGELLTTPGQTLDVAMFLEQAFELLGMPANGVLIADPYRMRELKTAIDETGAFRNLRFVPQAKRWRTSEDNIRNTQRAFLEEKVKIKAGELMATAAFGSARIEIRDQGGTANMRLKARSNRGATKNLPPDDIVAASLLALGAGYPAIDEKPYEPPPLTIIQI